MNKSLNEKVKEYADLKAQADSIAEQLTALKEEIVEAMGDEDEFTADDGTIAKINAKETFKYVDEPAMINWLKSNGYAQYVIEKVNTTPMNKELKKRNCGIDIKLTPSGAQFLHFEMDIQGDHLEFLPALAVQKMLQWS